MLSPSLRSILKEVSRSFYLSVRVLPPAVQEQVAVGYLLARAADTLADTPILPAAERRRLLSLLRQAAAGAQTAQQQLLAAFSAASVLGQLGNEGEARLLQRLGDCFGLLGQQERHDQALLQRVLDQLTYGMERDLERFPCSDAQVPASQVVGLQGRADLDDYAYFAAGCVGEFWTDLMASHVPDLAHLAAPELRRRGVALGKALQLVNVIRDVRADLQIGRCYWPDDMLHAHGLSARRLAEIAAATAAPPLRAAEASTLRALTHALCDLSLSLCREAWPYVQAIPVTQVRLRLACLWPLLLAVDTLGALRAAGSPLLGSGPPIKIARQRVYALLLESAGAAVRDRLWGGGRIDRLFFQHADRLEGA